MENLEELKHLLIDVWQVVITHKVERDGKEICSGKTATLFNSYSEAARYSSVVTKEFFPPEGTKMMVNRGKEEKIFEIEYDLNGKHHTFTREYKNLGRLYNSISDVPMNVNKAVLKLGMEEDNNGEQE
jgi:hypothetical protein